VRALAVAPLKDGRLVVWATDSAGGLYTTRKKTSDPDTEWLPWKDFFLMGPGSLPAAVQTVSVGPLSDGRLELWAAVAGGGLWTTWQNDSNPDVPWHQWTDFLAEVPGLPPWQFAS
jgi:hypothetical protein